MTYLKMISGNLEFIVKMEKEMAPRTCEWFLAQLPFKSTMLHGRFAGHATVVSIGDLGREVGFENTTSYPSRGDILMYHGVPGINIGEILIPYGPAYFSCAAGPLQGNHFLTVVEGNEQLEEMGRLSRWEGAQEIIFEKMDE